MPDIKKSTPGFVFPQAPQFEAKMSKKGIDDESISECTSLNVQANDLASQRIGGFAGLGAKVPHDAQVGLEGVLARRRELSCSNPEVVVDPKAGLRKP